MKKYFLDIFFSNCRWYRRRVGGTWYWVYDPSFAGGAAGGVRYWTQEPNDLEIVKQEAY